MDSSQASGKIWHLGGQLLSKKKTKSDPPVPVDPIAGSVLRTSEIQKTLRTLIWALLIAFCVWVITDAIVKLLDQPPWLTVVIAIISGIIAPVIHNFWLQRRIKLFTKAVADRNRRLEESVDFKRSSSGLEVDGTTPKGDDL